MGKNVNLIFCDYCRKRNFNGHQSKRRSRLRPLLKIPKSSSQFRFQFSFGALKHFATLANICSHCRFIFRVWPPTNDLPIMADILFEDCLLFIKTASSSSTRSRHRCSLHFSATRPQTRPDPITLI